MNYKTKLNLFESESEKLWEQICDMKIEPAKITLKMKNSNASVQFLCYLVKYTG